MINKSGRRNKVDQEFEDFGKDVPTERIYSQHELEDFHKKIQRFHEPKTIQNPDREDFGQTYLILNWNEMATAFGAFRKVQHTSNPEGKPVYVYMSNPERYTQLNNLWKQYNEYRLRQDWVMNKENERLQEMSNVPF